MIFDKKNVYNWDIFILFNFYDTKSFKEYIYMSKLSPGSVKISINEC